MVDRELLEFVAERVDILLVSDASTDVTKKAAFAWKDAMGADPSEATFDDATNKLLDVLEGRPTTIDGVIAFAEGPAAVILGFDAAAKMLAEQLERKEQGAKYCNCEACTAATELLAKFDRIEL